RLIAYLPALACAAALVATLVPTTRESHADGRGPVIIDINGPKRDLYKIAVPRMVGDRGSGQTAADVVSGDLGISGWFKPLDPRQPGAGGRGDRPAVVAQRGRRGRVEGEGDGGGRRAGDGVQALRARPRRQAGAGEELQGAEVAAALVRPQLVERGGEVLHR